MILFCAVDGQLSTGKSVMKNLFKRNKLLAIVSLMFLLAVGSELFARFVIGAGDPILIMDHPAIGYMARPSQSGTQLHNHYFYNSYGMRSEEFPANKPDSNEIRVLLIGDSIIAGGVHTDQGELASEIIKSKLSAITGRPVVVANISCGGWAPKNQLEYIRHFGTFDADIAVWVMSSHDYSDYVPNVSFAGNSTSFPSSKPLCASTELLGRAGIISAAALDTTGKRLDYDECVKLNHNCFKQMTALLRSKNVDLMLVQHLTISELINGPDQGFLEIAGWAEENNVEKFDFSSLLKDDNGAVNSFYRDDIHINASGQLLYADAILDLILSHIN